MKQFSFRLNSWQGGWPGLAVLLVAAALLWVGFALALVLALLAGVTLLVSRIRRLWARKPAAREPQVIEGQYTRLEH